MRREGVLTGYLWDKSFGKVKVKGKPTNASNVSGRCRRAKCPKCHQQPVSKAKSKAKGRNKRALSRVLVDDEWAFCKCARRIKAVLSVPSHVDHDDDYIYDALDACHADAELCGHDVDDYAYDVRDVCHADPKLMHLDVNDNANADPDLNPGICANADDVINDDDDDYAYSIFGVCHAEAKLMRPDVNDGHDIKEAHYVSTPHNVDYPQTVMVPLKVFALDGSLYTVMSAFEVVAFNNPVKKIASDVNPVICAKANDAIIDNDDEDGDVHHGCHAMMAHAEDDVALEEEEKDDNSNSNRSGHAMILLAADDVSGNDDDACDDDAAKDFQSLISGLGKVELPTYNDNEEVSDAESEENNLGGDWCHVSSSDTIDDWYLC